MGEEIKVIPYKIFKDNILSTILEVMNREAAEMCAPGIHPFLEKDLLYQFTTELDRVVRSAANRINEAEKIGAIKTRIEMI